ncbi:amidohydrolase family protein [Actinoplanes bogorensis]|uniref:Amidohydrolase family protein n=1 Tax=Paractinoplanes bogorensis TaxID=1610840 RepID=A0ABS5YV28_9ACTN|nr:amidohydrolase family protein [Actinoplanes bogorensis]MBU2667223.1 amidohydrolase family protein [Actinoplanes bogorensis]
MTPASIDDAHEMHSTGCAVCDAGRNTGADGTAVAERLLSRRALLGGAAGAAAAIPLLSAAPAAAAPAPRGDRTLVLEPSWVLTYEKGDLQLRSDHSVVVQDGRIAAITAGRLRGHQNRIEMPGQLLIPGMISAHTHVALGSSTRGLIESGRSFAIPGVRSMDLDDDDLDALTAYNLAEILRAGCTTQVEQSLDLRHAQSYVRVARRWGVRGYPAPMLPNFARVVTLRARTTDQELFDSVPAQLKEIEAALRWGRTVNGAEGGRIRPQMAPQGPETATPETLDAIFRAARQLGNGIHTHLATGAPESATVARLWGKAPVKWIEDHGFYDVPLIGAHLGGWDVTGDAPFLAGKKNFTYAHCPSGAGAGAGSAGQPFIEALAAGINTAVALDSHSNDMIENAKLAVLYGRLRHSLISATSPVPVRRPTVWDMIKSVTVNPANGLGRADLGRIEVGAKADLTSIDVSGFLVGAGVAGPEPLNNLLYANGLHVRNVMTEGRLQIRDGRLVVDDERRVVARGGAVVRKLWARLRAEGWFTPTPR